MRLVILESPFAGDVERNTAYAKAAIHDCLERGEAPIASHLLFTQPGILRDGDPDERRLGLAAGWAWYSAPGVAAVYYLDRAMSSGMSAALAIAKANHVPVEFRFLEPLATVVGRDQTSRPVWGRGTFGQPADGTMAEGQTGRLEAAPHRRAPTAAAPFLASVGGSGAAFYRSMEEAQAGAELWDTFLARNPQARVFTAGMLTGR